MDKLSDPKRRLKEFVEFGCPCFRGGSCNRVRKVMVKDEEELPKGISKVEMEMFRLLDFSEETKKSFGYECVPHYVDLFLCPTLRNLVDSLRRRPGANIMSTKTREENFIPKRLDLELGMSPEDMNKYVSYWCAETVITDYNNKHATNYKLVEAINGRGFVDLSMCYHCVFTAIDTSISSTCELFFAEIQRVQRGEFNVLATRILDDTQITYDCCSVCSNMKIPHPVDRFNQGIWYYLRPPQNPEYSQRLSVKRVA